MTLVIQIEPEPTPTLTASTPALIKSSAPCAVAIFPAINSQSGNAFFDIFYSTYSVFTMTMSNINN